MMMGFVFVYSNGRRIEKIVCESFPACFFSIVLGILSGPGVLLFVRFFRQMSYVSLSKYSCNGVCGFPLLSMTNPSRSFMF